METDDNNQFAVIPDSQEVEMFDDEEVNKI